MDLHANLGGHLQTSLMMAYVGNLNTNSWVYFEIFFHNGTGG
jgi:hypothetical protein